MTVDVSQMILSLIGILIFGFAGIAAAWSYLETPDNTLFGHVLIVLLVFGAVLWVTISVFFLLGSF